MPTPIKILILIHPWISKQIIDSQSLRNGQKSMFWHCSYMDFAIFFTYIRWIYAMIILYYLLTNISYLFVLVILNIFLWAGHSELWAHSSIFNEIQDFLFDVHKPKYCAFFLNTEFLYLKLWSMAGVFKRCALQVFFYHQCCQN